MTNLKYPKAIVCFCILVFTLLFEGCSVLPKFPSSPFLTEKENGPPYRGVFHVHTKYSHDSSGSIEDVIHAANGQHLDFVVITDHNTLKGKAETSHQPPITSPLMIVGNEISTTDGHLIALGINEEILPPIEPQPAIDQIHNLGGYAVLAHPVCDRTAWKDWTVKNYDAIEIYNYACDFYSSNKFEFILKSLLFSPTLFIKQTVKEPRDLLHQWDFISMARPVPGIGAIDAHVHNLLGIPFIRYSLSFRAATQYVNAKSNSEKDILEALIHGNSFTVFESHGQARNFTFEARSGSRAFESGSKVKSESPVTLFVNSPAFSEIRLFRNGEMISKHRSKTFVFDVREPGIYRAEVFKNGKLWIISNAIAIQI